MIFNFLTDILDSSQVCSSESVDFYQMSDADLVIIKTNGRLMYKKPQYADCPVIIGPGSDSARKYLRLEFTEFEILDCGIKFHISTTKPSSTYNEIVEVSKQNLYKQLDYMYLIYTS